MFIVKYKIEIFTTNKIVDIIKSEMSALSNMSHENICLDSIAQIYAENVLDDLCLDYKDIREFNDREDARIAMLNALKELFKKSVHNLDWNIIFEEMKKEEEMTILTDKHKDLHSRGDGEMCE